MFVHMRFAWIVLMALHVLTPTPAIAANADPLSDYKQLLLLSGVQAHFNTIQATIVAESTTQRSSCNDTDELKSAVANYLSELYHPASLMGAAISSLQGALTADDTTEILAWINSPAGKRIAHAESATADIPAADFSIMQKTYMESTQWTEQRVARVRAIMESTGIARFLTVLNTELSTAVTMAGACNTDSDSLATIDKAIDSARADEGLILVFMRPDLINSTGTIFRELSDADLDSYIEFADSTAGRNYHRALISTTRKILAERVEKIESFIKDVRQP